MAYQPSTFMGYLMPKPNSSGNILSITGRKMGSCFSQGGLSESGRKSVMEFELGYYDITALHVCNDATRTTPRVLKKGFI